MNATPMHDEDLLKVFEVGVPHIFAWIPTSIACSVGQRRPTGTVLASPLTILPALASQALDPQGTGTIPAAEFLKSLAIFGGDNAFTPDEVRCTENSEPSLRP